MLMPAAVLVVIALGAMAADISALYLQRRELTVAAQSAANDAAAYAVSQPTFYGGGGLGDLDHDRRRLAEVVEVSLDRRGVDARPSTEIVDDRLYVTLEGPASYVFAGAVPGFDDDTTVRARAWARLELGPS